MILALLFVLSSEPLVLYAASAKNSTRKTKVTIKDCRDAEFAFYRADFDDAAYVFDSLQKKKDRNFAFFNNQLGSIYLAKGDYELALDSFLKAYYLMNDTAAFSKLERGAVSLFGGEEKKAYKGDPYEKVYNSLYTGLLLYEKGDVENAFAAFKNGILCDSDAKGELYKSDAFIVYLFAARAANTLGNSTLGEDYFKQAVNAYYSSFPLNRLNISQEQEQRLLLDDKLKEYSKLDKGRSEKRSKKTQKKMDELKLVMDGIGKAIERIEQERNANNATIDTKQLEAFIDKKNNTFLIIELGKGPVKYNIGQYGEMAIIAAKPLRAEDLKISIDGTDITKGQYAEDFSNINDVYFQASTRGGRMMDGILKGHAQFKATTAQLASSLGQASQDMMNQVNNMSAMNPYYDASAGLAAAGAMAAIGLVVSLASAAANPVADIRHWSLMPRNLTIIPLSLAPGEHKIEVELLDKDGAGVSKTDIDCSIKSDRDNFIFKRFL